MGIIKGCIDMNNSRRNIPDCLRPRRLGFGSRPSRSHSTGALVSFIGALRLFGFMRALRLNFPPLFLLTRALRSCIICFLFVVVLIRHFNYSLS